MFNSQFQCITVPFTLPRISANQAFVYSRQSHILKHRDINSKCGKGNSRPPSPAPDLLKALQIWCEQSHSKEFINVYDVHITQTGKDIHR